MAKSKSGTRPPRAVRQQPVAARGEASTNARRGLDAHGQPKRSWLDGPPPRQAGYPGDRLRYPQTGRGSMASPGSKLGALVVDLVVAAFVALVVTRPHTPAQFQVYNAVADGVFVVATATLLALSGRTIGMRAAGVQVVRLDGKRMGWRSVPRQLLVGLLVPAIIVNKDRRGLHDQWLRTAVVNVR